MSLQVWLPLNGNLDNFGLSDVNVTSSGSAVMNDSGKIGKCYSFGTSNGAIQFTETPIQKFTGNFSFSLWVNISSWGSSYDTYLYCGKGDSAWASYIFGLLRNNQNSNVIFVISNGTTATNTSLYSSALSLNTWYHITCTYEPGKMKIYLNGILDKELATTIVPNYSLIQKCFIGALNASGAYQTRSKINDVRIYDHCLSPKEVKEISKALVLHYRLAQEGQTNLITGNFSCTSTNTTYKSQGSVGCIITAADLMANQGKTLTLSYDVYSLGNYTQNTAGNWQADRFGIHGAVKYTKNGASTQDYPLAGLLTRGKNGRVFTSWTIPTGITSFDTNLTFSTQTNGRDGYAFPASNNSSTWYLKNVKLEWGSVATPWIPNSADTIYTSMGYNKEIDCGIANIYDGAKTGTFEYSSDTPRYSTSTVFNGTNRIVAVSPTSEAKTLSVWAYVGDTISQSVIAVDKKSQLAVGFYSTTRIIVSCAGKTTVAYSQSGVKKNSWNHFVVVNNGTKHLLYLNGELYSTESGTDAWVQNTDELIIGCRNNGSYQTNYTGKISDFRLYATALSENDVKELYHTAAAVDNGNNMYAYEFVEVS